MAALLLITLFASWAAVAPSPAPVYAAAPAPVQTCTEVVTNGGFETTGGWQFGASEVPAQVVTSTAHSGTHSLQLGITGGANSESYSSARQTVTIPPGASQVTLSYWVYAQANNPSAGDTMELALLSEDGSVVLAKPWESHSDNRVWNQMAFDLSSWQGQTIQLYFNVYNDGKGGKTSMFLDDVSLTACPVAPTTGTPTPTGAPTATPTATFIPATATPSPTPGCTDLIRNGSFSSGLSDWETAGDPGSVTLSTDPVYSAPSALRLGSLDVPLSGLATARQRVTIPSNAPAVTLDVWILTQSQPGAGADYQEIALLNATGGLLYVPYRGPANDNAWVRLQFNLAAFAGQTVYLRFAVNNDGGDGRTVMYVDDVRLTACSSGITPTAAPTWTFTPAPALPTWTPAPTWTPEPPAPVTPMGPVVPVMPAGCAELTQNGGFEAGLAGWVPGANPVSPAVVTSPVLAGAYAAQMGSQVENANSYSSIRQTVTVPAGFARTFVSFWTYTWAELPAGADRQQFVLLGPGNVVWAAPWKVLENGQAWEQHIFELVGVGGQTFDLYFGVVNDGTGGRTALYLDEVHLWGCGGDLSPALTTNAAPAAAESGLMVDVQGTPQLPQTVPVPQVYPVETLPALVAPEEIAGAAAEMVPTAEAQWTVVAIGGAAQPLQGAGVISSGQAIPGGTPLAEIPAGAVAVPGAQATATPIVTISTTPQPASFLNNLTARWPPNWPLILIGIIVAVIIIVLIIRARQRS